MVGGPSERLVPPVMMDDGASGFAYPLFNSLTIPEIYSQGHKLNYFELIIIETEIDFILDFLVRNYPASATILHARLMQLEGVLKESKHVQSLDLSEVYSKVSHLLVLLGIAYVLAFQGQSSTCIIGNSICSCTHLSMN